MSDGDGGTVIDTLDVVVYNAAPAITRFTPTTHAGNEGGSFSYSAAATDVSADTISYIWDFGDGTTASGASGTHIYADDGTFAYTLTASDEDGGASTRTGTATIANVAPTVDIGVATTADEGSPIAITAGVTDPGTADTQTCVWDYGDGSGEVISGTSASHTYVDDGTYLLVLSCVDDDGGTGSDLAIIIVNNVAPTLTALSGDTSGTEGDTLSYHCEETDPGTADVVALSWNFGDGVTATGGDLTHSFADEGIYAVTCTANDGDGGVTSDSLSVTIDNSAPVIASLMTDTAGDEGASLAFAGTATDAGSADVLTWVWDFGDGTVATGDSVTHDYGDNGTWTVIVSLDDGTDTTQSSFTVDTVNVAPTIGGTPDTDTQDELAYSFAPSLDDPGYDDTWVWTARLPSTATLDAATGQIDWTPSYTEAGTYAIDLQVNDDDGGVGTLSWTLTVTVVDNDGDGLSDIWESAHGLDPSDASDATLDSDGDGRTNAEEYADGTLPDVYDGPSAPVALSPADGGEATTATVDLVVTNATGPRGDALLYAFEIYDDGAMTSLVSSAAAIAEDGTGQTAWTVDVPLTENTWYSWWANASDSHVSGPWSTPAAFFYSAVEEAPGAPGIQAPFDGSSVASLTPDLVLDEAFDPDEDPLSYTFVLTDDTGAEVTSTTGATGDGLEATWTADVALADGAEYCWYAFATDDTGLSGPDSTTSCFWVDLSNQPPSAPVITSPLDGSGVASLDVDVVLTDGVDPEDRAVLHFFELDTDPAFGSSDKQAADVPSDGSGTTTWTPDTLTDNTWYYVRALCSDGAAESAWVGSSFFVNTDNQAPEVPALYNPADGAAFAPGDMLSVINSTDLDGDALTYAFTVLDDSATEVDAGTVAEDSSGMTAWTPGGLADGSYTWSARATDPWGLSSDWAGSRAFTVGGVDTDTPIDTGDDGTDDTGTDDPGTEDTGKAKQADGCGCATPSSGMPFASWLLVGLAGAVLVRRRDA